MFKSTFSKYLFTFITIILVSFLVLSGIITSMIGSYFSEEKEERLVSTAAVVSNVFEKYGQTDISKDGFNDLASDMLYPVINNDREIDITFITDEGVIVLTTVGAIVDDEGLRRPHSNIKDQGKTVDVSLFVEQELSNDVTARLHRGTLDGFLEEISLSCIDEIHFEGKISGYVITSYSTAKEATFITTARRAIISSSAWVMIAAVIAVYFITQRIISPLRTMTTAAKRFGKGDFSTRVTVYGSDEVSELATAFNNMADSLEKLEKMRSSFLASVSHDLRTPMTTISGFIDGIMSGAIPPEKQEYYLQVISAEVHRLSRLVSQLLDVSRLESGDRKMNFETFDVAEVARIILISFEQKIDDKRLEVEFETEEDVMNVNADKDAIYQVIYNLCHNAIKFSDEGGLLSIRLSYDDAKHVKISVYDKGQVLSDEDKKFVFERFYKSDTSRGLDKNGVGLGLYICKTIIDAHEENIGVETRDEGTEFHFTLKIAK